MAAEEAAKAVALREAELQMEVERKSAGRPTEKVEFLSKVTEDYEMKVQLADLELYKRQKAAEATLYEQEKAAEATLYQQEKAAEAELYVKQKEAEAELYVKQKEAEGMVILAKAKGVCLRTLLEAFGGDYEALREYLMIDSGFCRKIGWINADVVRGMKRKISVYSGPATWERGAAP